MSLVEKIKDRYGWMNGTFPQDVTDAIRREPSCADTFEGMRKSGRRFCLGRALDYTFIAALFVPELTPYEGFGPDLLDIGVSAAATGMVLAKITYPAKMDLGKFQADIPHQDSAARLAAYDLETRILTTAKDAREIGLGAIFSAVIGYAATQVAPSERQMVMYAGIATTAMLASLIVAGRRILNKHRARGREYYAERKEIDEERGVLAAKNVTPGRDISPA